MGLYTFLYENLLYRLHFIHIQPARLVPARSPCPGSPVGIYSVYSYAAIHAMHAIQHTALYILPQHIIAKRRADQVGMQVR